jgi:DNA polymerase I-like protein with 3'-5' exonuclease and polymerase domains
VTDTRIFLDIETACNVRCTTKCEHALDFNRNKITVVGVGLEKEGISYYDWVYRDLEELKGFLDENPTSPIVGHNLSFDIKVLRSKGIDLTDRKMDDSQLMLLAYTEKVSPEWLEQYEEERKRINREEKKSHREAGRYSLKTAAPYFLGVKPFWEAEDKDNDEYVLTDVEYTRRLYHYLKPRLEKEGTYQFYKEKLIPWAKMLHEAEWAGIGLDLEKVAEKEREAVQAAQMAAKVLEGAWGEAKQVYLDQQRYEVRRSYESKLSLALSRIKPATLKDPVKAAARTAEKFQKVRTRYEVMSAKAQASVEPLNLDSPTQLTWLLKDYLGYDIEDYMGEETTGIEVLERLAAEGKEDVKTFIEYRQAQKLCTAFFPSYREMQFGGKLHCNFNISGTRTGRLSSSNPNLQQVPGDLHDIFVAKPGHLLICRDLAGIEPVVVAYFSQDPILCDLLLRDGNFHSYNAPAFFPYIDCEEAKVKKLYPRERDLAKTVGLALMYGAGWRRIQIAAMKAGFRWSREECIEKFESFKELYTYTFKFKDEVLDPALRSGKVISNLLGRKYRLSPDDVHMKGLNTLVQSSASDLVLQSARKINDEFLARGISGGVRLLVHDELVTEAEEGRIREAEEIVERCMTTYKLSTPYGDLPLHVEGKTAKVWAK